MRTPFSLVLTSAIIVSGLLVSARAQAHGIVGDRFFPPTITTDDPFAADELALPTVSIFKNPGDPQTREIDAGFELDKLILPDLSLGISTTHVFLKPDHARSIDGWGNVELSLKYNAWSNAAHEAVVAVGVRAEIGGTGSRSIGRDSRTTFQPSIFFGKGFGDLPDSLAALKPIAVTGLAGLSFPTNGDPNVLEWGFSLQYQLPYLQQHVKDIGLPEPLKNMIPLVEFAFESPINRAGGPTTGTINPGVLYETKYFQVGVEALIPINEASGKHVGAIFQIWIFLDDIAPKYFGHPIFGN
jgi:hypothetical protein